MKKLAYSIIFFATALLFSRCSDDTEFTKNLNFITFESKTIALGVDIDGSTLHTIKVYTSNVTSSDRTFSILVNEDGTSAEEAAYSIPETVTVPANTNEGVIELTLNDVNIGDGKSIILSIGAEDGLFTGPSTKIDISQICQKNDVQLSITFDGYASECSWELLNAADEVIASGSDYADGDERFTTNFCLDNGSYTFKVYDAYGDGLSYPENGSVKLSKDGTELFSAEGDFGAEASGTFSVTL